MGGRYDVRCNRTMKAVADIIGKRISLGPYDDYFQGMGTVVGTITRRVIVEGKRTIWSLFLSRDHVVWYLLEIDHPLEYLGKTRRRFLIRSRWRGSEVGAAEPVSAFLADDISEEVARGKTIGSNDLLAWVTATTVSE